MKTAIVIKIDDKSLESAGLTKEAVMQIALETIAREFDSFGLDYDCGYNPQLVTNEHSS